MRIEGNTHCRVVGLLRSISNVLAVLNGCSLSISPIETLKSDIATWYSLQYIGGFLEFITEDIIG